MLDETYTVALHDGLWRIAYQGQWYGAYSDKRSATRLTVSLAKSAGELPTRVAVRDVDGTEEVVWDPFAEH
jgi:hypothetical protein